MWPVLRNADQIKYILQDGLVVHLTCGGIRSVVKPLYLRDKPYEEEHDIRAARKGHEAQAWVAAPLAVYRDFVSCAFSHSPSFSKILANLFFTRCTLLSIKL